MLFGTTSSSGEPANYATAEVNGGAITDICYSSRTQLSNMVWMSLCALSEFLQRKLIFSGSQG